MRITAIWIFGILASMIVGSLIGARIGTSYSGEDGFMGALAGAFTFTCARLWLGQSKTRPD